MEASTQIATPTTPLAGFVGELRDFLASHRMHFGSPEDVPPFTEALSDPGTFRDEMASMMRSVILREGGNIPRAELLQLVMLAVGGPRVEEAADDLLPFLQIMLNFLAEVHRSRWGIVPPELPVADGVGSAVGDAANHEPQHPVLSAPPVAVDAQAESEEIQPEAAAAVPVRTAEIYFQQRMRKSAEESVDGVGDLRTFPAPLPATSLAEPDVEDVEGAAGVAGTNGTTHALAAGGRDRRNGIWVAAACAVLLVVLAAVALHRRAVEDREWIAQHVRPVAQTASGVVSTPVKPSPYDTAAAHGNRIAPARRAQVSRLSDSWFRSGPSGAGAVEATNRSPTDGLSSNIEQSAPAQQTTPSTPENRSTPAPIYRIEPTADFTPSGTSAQGSTFQQAPDNRATQNEKRLVSPTAPSVSLRHERSLNVSSGVMAANLISSAPPEYPTLAKLTHIQGRVIMQAVVSRSGTVVATHVLDGHRLLRGAAEKAVRQWRYRPYILNGKPTDVATVITVDFRRTH